MTLVRLAVAAVLAAACSNKPAPEERAQPESRPADEPRPAEPAKPAAPVPAARTEAAPAVAIPAGFPPECVAYAELIRKLEACDRLGAARDGMRQSYLDVQSAWSAVPPERRAEVTEQCRTQADSLRNAAAAACGW